MALIQVPPSQLFVDNASDMITTKTNLTTIYAFGLLANSGLNIFTSKMYSRVIPDIDNLDDYLKDNSDLESGMYQAIQMFSNSVNKSDISDIVTSDGRVTKFININNDINLMLIYDRDREHYVQIEDLIESLANKAKSVLIDYADDFYNYQTTGKSDFADLQVELMSVFNLGYNNKSSLNYINKLKNNLENKCRVASFMTKDLVQAVRSDFDKLRKLKTLFPNLDIDLSFYEEQFQRVANYNEVKSKKKEYDLSGLNLVKQELDLPKDFNAEHIKILVNNLQSDNVVNALLKPESLIKETKILKSLIDDFESNRILIQLKCIDINGLVQSYLGNQNYYLNPV